MSAAPRYPEHLGYAGLRMTAAEFLSLGETNARYELVDGVIFMSPSPSYRRNRALRFLIRELELCADKVAGLDIVIETDIVMTDRKVYCPDLAVFAPGRLPPSPERLELAPDLIIEVLSPGSRPLDLVTKRDDYEAFGVGEYWVIEPQDVSARVWTRSGQKLVEAPVKPGDLRCAAIPGVVVDLARVRSRVGSQP